MAVRAAAYVRAHVEQWRTGSAESQWYVAALLLLCLVGSFAVSLWQVQWMPLAAYFVWLLVAQMLLRFGPLLVVAVVDAVLGLVALAHGSPLTGSRLVSMAVFVLAVVLVLVVSSRQRTGLPVQLSGAVLGDLKDRLQEQGTVPPLPEGWEAQSAVVAAHGAQYAGDFLVARLSPDQQRLELILVDVCGKGVTAGPSAIHFAGALGGLIGSMPPVQLFGAANDFLLRQREEESFATAVHLIVDLADGSYTITSAGHPPALRWDLPTGEWVLDNARGTALGVLPEPELQQSEGRLFPGEGLLFYTDGVVENRTSSIDAGIEWLRRVAGEAVDTGFGDAARRIISQVDSGEDDRAVLILSRHLSDSSAGRPVPRDSAPADESPAQRE